MRTRDGEVCIYVVAKADGIYTPAMIRTAGEVAADGEGTIELILDLPLGVVVKEQYAETAKERLLAAGLRLAPQGTTVRSVKGCPVCVYGVGNYIEEAVQLDDAVAGLEAPVPMRVRVNGCGHMCAMGHLYDVSFVKTANDAYDVYVGAVARNPSKAGERLCRGVRGEEMAPVVRHVVDVFKRNSEGGKRLPQVLGEIGIEAFREGLPVSAGE